MAYPNPPWMELPLPSPTPSSPEAPALAVSGGWLYLAWKTSDWTNRLYMTSTDGATFRPVICLDKTSPFGPALVAFDGKLYMAWTANDASNSVYLASSENSFDWSVSRRLDYNSLRAPSLAVMGARLYMAWAANDPSGSIYVTSSPDGDRWCPACVVPGYRTTVAPAICAVGGDLHLFGSYGPPGNEIFHLALLAGAPSWSPVPGLSLVTSPHRPSCAVNVNDIYLAWASSYASGPIRTMKRDAVPAWSAPRDLNDGLTAGQAPSIAILPPNVLIAWVTTDLSHTIKVAFNTI